MKKFLMAAIAASSLVLAASAAQAAPIYVGSWLVGDGPVWTSNPAVYSGQEAAALLFGGLPSDYAISTIDDNVANINNLAFLDGWADSQYLITPQSESFRVDTGNPGYNDPAGFGTAYSAYVLDHTCNNRYNDPNAACSGDGTQYRNFAFRLDAVEVPEPLTLSLFGAGFAGAVAVRRRKQKSA